MEIGGPSGEGTGSCGRRRLRLGGLRRIDGRACRPGRATARMWRCAGFSPTAVAVENDLLWIASSGNQSVRSSHSTHSTRGRSRAPRRAQAERARLRPRRDVGREHGRRHRDADRSGRLVSDGRDRGRREPSRSPRRGDLGLDGGGTVTCANRPGQREVVKTIDVGNARQDRRLAIGNVWVSVQSP